MLCDGLQREGKEEERQFSDEKKWISSEKNPTEGNAET
jgi:hypothetical protein